MNPLHDILMIEKKLAAPTASGYFDVPESWHTRYPLPPKDLMRGVLGEGAVEGSFLYGGYVVAEGLKSILKLTGRKLSEFNRILDFGCGCGRVLRWFDEEAAKAELHGSDIDNAAINWCRQHLPFAAFSTNGPLPPLPYPDDFFDLIYSISLLTHLNEDYQFQWLKELKRIAKPEAVIVQTVHGLDQARLHFEPRDLLRLDHRGFVFKKSRWLGGLHGHPGFSQTAYHTNSYIEREWSRFFSIRGIIAHGPVYNQELVIMENTEGTGEGRESRVETAVHCRLPMMALDEPQLACEVESGELVVRGWAFYPDGEDLHVDLWIDGIRRCSFEPAEPRPDVGEVFSAFPASRRAGFSSVVQIADLPAGPHRLWLTRSENSIPCVSAYFVKL